MSFSIVLFHVLVAIRCSYTSQFLPLSHLSVSVCTTFFRSGLILVCLLVVFFLYVEGCVPFMPCIIFTFSFSDSFHLCLNPKGLPLFFFFCYSLSFPRLFDSFCTFWLVALIYPSCLLWTLVYQLENKARNIFMYRSQLYRWIFGY